MTVSVSAEVQDVFVRLVATDLDGTLLRPDATVSARSIEVLNQCRERGIDVVLVTGRPQRWLAPVRAAADADTIALCSNGASVVHVQRDQLVRALVFAPADVRRAVAALQAVVPGAHFAVETTLGPFAQTGFPGRHPAGQSPPTMPLGELLSTPHPVLKLLCRTEHLRADAMLELARVALVGIAEPVHSNPADSMLEISALGVTKAAALADYAASRGIDAAEVIAFGDMPNDVSMLRWAGIGVAMADGHPEALAAAEAIAPSSSQDGVAQVLQTLLDDGVTAIRTRTRP